ncbi:MAG: endonuclease MutS2 [Oscillospiraceae bacterium]|nr:endonuclease MutS2 [Oscillospiraceae bacterium]
MGKVLTYEARLEFDKVLAQIAEHACSAAAKAALLATQPETELYKAYELLEVTDALFVQLSRAGSPSISAVSDIPELCMRAEKGGMLGMGELIRIRSMLRNARALNAWYNGGGAAVCDALFYALYEDVTLERRLGDAILSETEMSDDASPQLREIRRLIRKAESSVRDKLDAILRSSATQKYLQDAVVTLRGGRFVVPVKQEPKNEITGLGHDVSSSGSTYFVEPAAVVEANNRIMELKGEELKEIDRILGVFSEEISGIGQRLRDSYAAFVQLDAALAKAKYAAERACAKPLLNDEGRIVLKKARHPLIPKNTVVPIDLTLGVDYNALVITVPNTGGKTVTLKTVGLLTLMASSGIPVTANDGSELCVFSRVLVDIGDEQSIEQSLSTFSAHIKTTAEILRVADEQSLVLLDELGAGTDPAEGAALATAILERLRSRGCRVLATTHYGELKMYALETDGVQNASCEFDVATLRPTYRLNIGIPGRSNALLIGEKLGLDKTLLDDARRSMKQEDRRFEDVLNEIEALKSELSRKQDEIEAQKLSAEETVRQGKAEYERLAREGRRELDAAKLRAKQIASDVQANAYKLMDELKKLEMDKDKNVQEARRRAKAIANSDKLYDMADPVAEFEADNLPKLTTVAPGDAVYVAALRASGTAMSAPDAKGMVEVQTGSVKTRVSLAELRRPPAAPKKKARTVSAAAVMGADVRSGQNEINLLGKTVDEAVLEVDAFIDSAVLSHINTVYIIHGRGTGALRTGIQQHLRTMRQVKSFRLGKYGEGEDGVTVVELK